MPKKHKRKTEQNFEYRIQKKLTQEGWLVLNCTMSYPFDLVAIKNRSPVILELKSRFTKYPDEQRKYQREMCKATGNGYVLVRQLPERNRHGFKIKVEPYNFSSFSLVWKMLLESLSNFLD